MSDSDGSDWDQAFEVSPSPSASASPSSSSNTSSAASSYNNINAVLQRQLQQQQAVAQILLASSTSSVDSTTNPQQQQQQQMSTSATSISSASSPFSLGGSSITAHLSNMIKVKGSMSDDVDFDNIDDLSDAEKDRYTIQLSQSFVHSLVCLFVYSFKILIIYMISLLFLSPYNSLSSEKDNRKANKKEPAISSPSVSILLSILCSLAYLLLY